MADATGEASKALRAVFDRRVKLEFDGARITSDVGLLAYRELNDVLGLIATGVSVLSEGRRGKNVRHRLLGLLRQAGYGRLAGCEKSLETVRFLEGSSAADPAACQALGRTTLGICASRRSTMLLLRARSARYSRPSTRAAGRIGPSRTPCIQPPLDPNWQEFGMATIPIRMARPHEFLKWLPTALVVSVGLLAFTAIPSTAGASPSPKKRSQPATLIAPITPPLHQYSDTQIIVSFKGGMPREAMQNAERAIGAREISFLHVGSAYLLAVQSGHVLESIRALKSHPAVRYAEPDYLAQLAAIPNDPSFPIQWAYRNTGQLVNGTSGIPNADEKATPAWSLTPRNAVVVAETDTGVDYTHPDLAGNIWTNPGGIGGCAAGTHGYNVRNSTCDPMDDDTAYGGHGTHVAGILGAVGNNGIGVSGVNWRTTVLPVKWVSATEENLTSDLIAALNWILNAKKAGVPVRVVNDSTVFVGTAPSQTLSDEIDLLGKNSILFVTAAGNTGDNNDVLSVRRYPCGYDRSTEICVAASNQSDALPSWANYGPNTVDLAAPGSNIYSTLRNNSYGFIDGSSMATAQVAGAAAYILRVRNMSPTQLKADILNNVDKLPSLSGKLITGGRLDMCKAVPGCVP